VIGRARHGPREVSARAMMLSRLWGVASTTLPACMKPSASVIPDHEHHGRGEAIREARRQGLARARDQRLAYNRRNNTTSTEETP